MRTNQKKLLASKYPSSYTQLKKYRFKLASKIYQENLYIVSLKVDGQRVFYVAVGNNTRRNTLPILPIASKNIGDLSELISNITFDIMEARRQGKLDSLMKRLRDDFMPINMFSEFKNENLKEDESKVSPDFRIKQIEGDGGRTFYVVYDLNNQVVDINTHGTYERS